KELSKIAPSGKRKELDSLALEFLGQSSKESVFVKDLDMVEMCLQALYYQKKGRVDADMGDFFRKTERELRTKTGKKLFAQVKKEFLALSKK
ncbi:MAG: HD domain-containing protein, partial [Candidatus Diapherotrites archaeon]